MTLAVLASSIFWYFLRLTPQSVQIKLCLWVARRMGNARLELACLEVLRAQKDGATDDDLLAIARKYLGGGSIDA